MTVLEVLQPATCNRPGQQSRDFRPSPYSRGGRQRGRGGLAWLSGGGVRPRVCIANDGEAGVAVARQFQPDMVLMYIGMPKLNGYEAASRIRQQPWGRAMMLVALTGWGQADDRRKSANAGFNHHLVKPIDMDDLIKLVSGDS